MTVHSPTPPRRLAAVRLRVVFCWLLLATACVPGQPAAPVPARPGMVDGVEPARRLLEEQRTAARLASAESPARRILRLVDLGLYQDADSLLASVASRTLEVAAAEAELRYRQYRFAEAARLVEAVLEQQRAHRAARYLSVRLAIQAWQLDWAEELARALLARRRRDPEAALLLGRVQLLRGDYDGALEWAERAGEWGSVNADPLVLAAEARMWRGEPAEAEATLRRALAIDPLDADARFGYGYALWRRGDPALLPAMAAQWNLALEVDPLHHPTHWHLGNGHTPLTYADYASVADTLVRAALAPVDSLIAEGWMDQAIAATREVETQFPGSILPALWRGSAFYLAALASSPTALDSAQSAFRTVLSVVPNFGPAHNGVAAVLKQRQFRALARYDSLESAIALTPIAAPEFLYEVFPDLRRYAGDRIARMVSQQLGPAVAFLPFVSRQGQRVFIPPLHRDLAAATGDASFRTATTFDNRQWMDIRGVGGSRVAAAGIEYLERGSHQERGVLLHEFVHLVHATVLTDAQRRRVRELYLAAMRGDRTLDYYAASNEQEFLAQAVEAYQSLAKVHPLNHKSMNTRDDLLRKDPETYAFIDALVADLERYRAGEPGALRSNWAEVYVNLARETRADGHRDPGILSRAAALLDSALVWDPAYLPAMIEYAAVEGELGRTARAEEWLRHAESIDPGYAPVLVARAELLAMDETGLAGAAETRAALLRRAIDLERDSQLRARYYGDLWALYEDLGRVPDAIAVAEEYARIGPTVSTRLRSARENAEAEAVRLRMEAGYAEESLPFLRARLAASPRDFDRVGLYSDALRLAGVSSAAEEVLEQARALLDAAGEIEPKIHLRLAELRLAVDDTAGARDLVDLLLRAEEPRERQVDGRLVRLLVAIGEVTEAHRRLASLPQAREPAERAELEFTRGSISAWRGDVELAERLYREAVALDPYHLSARVRLYRLLRDQGRIGEAREVAEAATRLPMPLGPAFALELARE